MFKAILHEKQILIVLLGSILIFIGYNVLTVEATTEEEEEKDCRSISEPDDDFYCKEFDWSAFYPDRENVEEFCDASEDYAKNPKNCDKAYGLVEKAEEKAAKEDVLCDDEDADTTDIKLCMSEEREHHYEDQQIEKEVCEDEGFEWKHNGGCDTKGDDKKWDEVYYKVGEKLAEREIKEDKEEEEKEDGTNNIVEDWRNEVEPIENVKIGSPVFIPLESEGEEEQKKEAEEKIDEYNRQMDEYHHGGEEEENDDDDESEDDEQEEDEPEEDNSDLES